MTKIELYNRPPRSNTKNYWAYYRGSGIGQDLSSQMAMTRKYCEENGLYLTREFADDAKTGTTTAGRHDFERMIELASHKHAPVDAVIYVKSSRFGRNQEDVQWVRAVLRRNQKQVIPIETIVPKGAPKPVQRVVESLEDFTDEIFIQNLKDNIERGKLYRLDCGCAPVGRAKKGYRFIQVVLPSISERGGMLKGNKPVVDEQAAALIIRAFELRARGATLEVISKETGIFKPNSGMWYRLFSDQTYTGRYTFMGIEYDDVYPAIISQALFDAVQLTMPPESNKPLRKRSSHPRRRGSSFILGNFAYCGYCGAHMVGKSGRSRGYRRYICSRRNSNPKECKQAVYIPSDELHENILSTLTKLVIQEKDLEALMELTNEYLDSEINEVRLHYLKLEESHKNARSSLMKMLRNFGEMAHTIPEAEQLIFEQRELVDRLEQELARVGQLSESQRIQVDQEDIRNYLEWVGHLLKGGEYWDLREVVEQFCQKIVITADECILYIKVPDPLL